MDTHKALTAGREAWLESTSARLFWESRGFDYEAMMGFVQRAAAMGVTLQASSMLIGMAQGYAMAEAVKDPAFELEVQQS